MGSYLETAMKFRDIILSSAICGFFCWVLTTVIIGSGGVNQSSITLDIVRNRAVATAVMQYAADNDSRLPIAQRTLTYQATGPTANRAWSQLVLPYHGSMLNHRDPDNPISEAELMSELPNCTNSPIQCEFNLAIKSYRGYNNQYLSPIATCVGANRISPAQLTSIGNPSRTILAVDSAWNRVNGQPRGGGNHIVDPPARFTQSQVDTLPALPSGCSGRFWNGGWNPSNPLAWNAFGTAYPYHKNGSAVVAFTDGHVAIMNMTQLAAGATVLNGWGGRITDRDAYLWDLQ